jgi:hypothetical protein
MMQWIIPGEPFPSKPGYSMPVLEALKKDLWVAWWRVESPPPPSRLVRYVETTPSYRMSFSTDFEEYWRENGHFKTVRRIRNRCAKLKLVVNAPGAAEWTIRNCEEKWREKGTKVDPFLLDKILAAEYMEARKRYYTFSLLDEETFVAGATVLVHRNDLVAGTLYRDPQYHKLGVGDRLIDISFSFAKENGFETFDIGGGHPYKKQWAPEDGQRWWFNVSPEFIHRIKEAINWGKRLISNRSLESTHQLSGME